LPQRLAARPAAGWIHAAGRRLNPQAWSPRHAFAGRWQGQCQDAPGRAVDSAKRRMIHQIHHLLARHGQFTAGHKIIFSKKKFGASGERDLF
jgi:hypothetical protein